MRMGEEPIDPSGAAHGRMQRCVKLSARENEVKDDRTRYDTPRRSACDERAAPAVRKRPVIFRHEDEG